MDYRERFAEENESVRERMELISDRILQIEHKPEVAEIYADYFKTPNFRHENLGFA